MQWHVLAIGKPRLGFAREGVEEYTRRLRAFASVKVDFLKLAGGEEESAALLRRSEGMYRIALDETGEQVSSRELSARVEQWEQGRHKQVALLIGGANGHTAELRKQAGWVWALGLLTLQHEMALVLVLEQIYRAYTIKGGLPYHRD